ncbi:unnamed protein product [Vitrella brassicaformis CCMP3155]|uniref:FAM86 N-terminal domain-containing protein n=1 Tax=Vitrella brassicaformis (strain CCMP3155) TaxID=1169540 RepID=A0A0G4GDH1_VITBC|nr:unnamed protein product [Vitrella brassicaformis CCMP3155]|eukprot:CEM27427.1 unnamed protein product [Vitrella brassicaformis CCMP3155]
MAPVDQVLQMCRGISFADDCEIQDWFCSEVVNGAIATRRPPSVAYTSRLMKLLVQDIELQQREPSDALLETTCTRMEQYSAASKEKPPCFVTYILPEGEPVSCRIYQEKNEVGLRLWEAAFYLAEYFWTFADLLDGRRCVELGSGVGLAAIMILRKCRLGTFVLTDYLPSILANLRFNLEENGIALSGSASEEPASVSVELLDLEKNPGVKLGELLARGIDTVVASDVLYDPDLVKGVVHALSVLLPPPKATASHVPVAYIAATRRNDQTMDIFRSLCADAGLTVEVDKREVRHLFEYDRRTVEMLRITCCVGMGAGETGCVDERSHAVCVG